MKNKGFTLVELLAVIVILAILLTIAIPSVLRISRNVKEESYNTKIKMIESAAVVYGQNNSRSTLNSMLRNNSIDYGDEFGWLYFDSDKVKISHSKTGNYKYPYEVVSLQYLADNGDLKYDIEDGAAKSIVNPIDDAVINSCLVYIYFKNNRIYAHFDRDSCDMCEDNDHVDKCNKCGPTSNFDTCMG